MNFSEESKPARRAVCQSVCPNDVAPCWLLFYSLKIVHFFNRNSLFLVVNHWRESSRKDPNGLLISMRLHVIFIGSWLFSRNLLTVNKVSRVFWVWWVLHLDIFTMFHSIASQLSSSSPEMITSHLSSAVFFVSAALSIS